MTLSRLALPVVLAACCIAEPALAIQEVQVGPRAPSFAAGSAPLMGFDPLALPGITSPQGYSSGSFSPVRDPAAWAFNGGETSRIGSVFFNVQSGPDWTFARGGNPGFSGLGFSPLTSFGRSPFDMGFTTRSTAGVLAAEGLMFYTSVGNTTWRTLGSAAPVAPGLQLLEAPSQRMDVRAGFKAELMPGVTFGMEAGFAQPMR